MSKLQEQNITLGKEIQKRGADAMDQALIWGALEQVMPTVPITRGIYSCMEGEEEIWKDFSLVGSGRKVKCFMKWLDQQGNSPPSEDWVRRLHPKFIAFVLQHTFDYYRCCSCNSTI